MGDETNRAARKDRPNGERLCRIDADTPEIGGAEYIVGIYQ